MVTARETAKAKGLLKVAVGFVKRPAELTAVTISRRQRTESTQGQLSPKGWQLIATTVRPWIVGIKLDTEARRAGT
jgi:hypothetical protein